MVTTAKFRYAGGWHTETRRKGRVVNRQGYGWIIPCYRDGWSGGLWHIESGVPFDNILGRSVFESRAAARKAKQNRKVDRHALGAPVKVRIDLTLVGGRP